MELIRVPMIRKPLDEIAVADVELLCAEGALEDEQLDFKETIPHRDGEGGDPWRSAHAIKDYGRDQLLATVVAFANSYGGDLVVGVRETARTQPGKAESVVPLPDCEDAAHRLTMMARACIDPPIPNLQIRGVTTQPDGSGVIVARAQKSRLAPHRLMTTHATMKECFHRVRHETLAMSMRQVQDLTFSAAQGRDAIELRLQQMRESFRDRVGLAVLNGSIKRIAIRFTAVPTSNDVFIEHVHNVDKVRPGQRVAYFRAQPNGQKYQLYLPFELQQWRPTLRGSEGLRNDSERKARISVFDDGVISYELVLDASRTQDDAATGRDRLHMLHPGWFFAMAVNAVESADRFRVAAGASVVDYVLDAEIAASDDLPVPPFGDGAWYRAAGVIPAGSRAFPTYVVGPPQSWPDMYALLYRDFWNSMGVDLASGESFLVEP